MLVFALSLAAVVTIDAPVTAVTVFSDRARVTRSASVEVSGSGSFVLPLLDDHAQADSLRVTASGGGVEVKRVEIAHVEEDDLPAGEARALLDGIDQVDDQIARARGEREGPATLLAAVRRVSPLASEGEPLKPRPRLDPTGWSAAFSFVDDWMSRMQARVRAADAKLRELDKTRAELVEKARILGASGRRAGHRVTVLLAGNGKAKLSVTYMALSARWVPSYDLQLMADQKRVQVELAGMVSQETGEDWSEARLVLSTAVPATATVAPTLLTWKIGERERFIPTPQPVVEVQRPAPPAVPPLIEPKAEDALRARLERVAAMTADQLRDEDKDAKGSLEQSFNKSAADSGSGLGGGSFEPPSAPPPMEPPPPPAAMAPAAEAYTQSAPARRSAMSRSAARPQLAGLAAGVRGSADVAQAADAVGLGPPPGYTPPYYSPDLPVSLAGGYDLSFPSLRPETIQSGKGARRVALLAEAWPVEVERRLYPALAPEAYVTAEIKNPSSRALPGGAANLSVGDDPAGTAQLSVMAPGETLTLPLGLDRALRPIRNVTLVQSQKGVFSKDDVNDYTVTIEVANPYRVALPVRVIDQLPLTSEKDVTITAGGPGSFDPPPFARDPIKGSLEWHVTLPASGKSVIRFSYSIRRPKGWRLHQ